MKTKLNNFILFHILILCFVNSVFANQTIKIGVLSHRGDEIALQSWGPMSQYLSESIDGYDFRIVPLKFDQIEPTVKNEKIDFLITNPAIYVDLEVRHRISRIATLNNTLAKHTYNQFGGVIFTLAKRSDINSIKDLKDKTMAAVDETSLGGFHMAWLEMKRKGITPHTDLQKIQFEGIHDKVVRAVLQKTVDFGTVRTGILESMQQAGDIKLSDFKVINEKHHEGFYPLHSTRLYPEWPFSKLIHTSNKLAQKVVISLLNMNELAVTKSPQYSGWTIPLEYQPVHDILQELKLSPYNIPQQFTLEEAIEKYWYWMLTVLLFILVLAFFSSWIFRLNRQLKKSKIRLENQYSLILDSVADGIYGVDLNGNSTFVNKAMENITGWTPQAIVGKNQHEILHHTKKDGSQHQAQDCPVYKTFQDQKPRFVTDDIFWKKDGTSFPVEYSATPLKDETAKTIGSVVVFRDISERVKAEAQLRDHQSKLAHVARLSNMGEMASGMAHELNQPLTAILSNSEACIRLLESKQNNSELLMDTLEIIGSQSKRASAIIAQLRQFVKKGSSERSLIDINQLINDVISLTKQELNNASISLNLQLSQQLPPLLVQPIQIDQVILNLMRNAIDSLLNVSKESRTLTISSGIKENTITICITDSGEGIRSDIIGQLFTPYITSKQQGMGLGLSISEGIIHAHQGKMFARNLSDRGAEFCFSLPTAEIP